MEPTYREMTTEHLGNDATRLDLDMFRLACQIASKANPTATAEEITDQMWGNGDWAGRALATIVASYASLYPEQRDAFDQWRDEG